MASRNVEELVNPLYIGNGANRAKVATDGTLTIEGDGTTWEDVQTSLTGRRLYSRSGAVDYDYDENAIVFQVNGDVEDRNDRVNWSIQYPHKAKANSSFNVHVHWEQDTALTRTWVVQYRIQSNGQSKDSTWTEVSVVTGGANDVFVYTSGTLNQITRLVDIDMTGAGISAVVQFRLAREDSNAGDVLATFVDAHYEIDSFGSSTEFVK